MFECGLEFGEILRQRFGSSHSIVLFVDLFYLFHYKFKIFGILQKKALNLDLFTSSKFDVDCLSESKMTLKSVVKIYRIKKLKYNWSVVGGYEEIMRRYVTFNLLKRIRTSRETPLKTEEEHIIIFRDLRSEIWSNIDLTYIHCLFGSLLAWTCLCSGWCHQSST